MCHAISKVYTQSKLKEILESLFNLKEGKYRTPTLRESVQPVYVTNYPIEKAKFIDPSISFSKTHASGSGTIDFVWTHKTCVAYSVRIQRTAGDMTSSHLYVTNGTYFITLMDITATAHPNWKYEDLNIPVIFTKGETYSLNVTAVSADTTWSLFIYGFEIDD